MVTRGRAEAFVGQATACEGSPLHADLCRRLADEPRAASPADSVFGHVADSDYRGAWLDWPA